MKKNRPARRVTSLVKAKLIQSTNVLFMSDAFSNPQAQADIEDLLDPAVFDALVAELYKTELQGKSLSLNANIPRIVKRYEDAFTALGLEFRKTRPARLFIEKMAHDPASVMGQLREPFHHPVRQNLQAHAKLVSRNAEPFR